MAHTHGTAISPDDLLTQIRTFLLANSWVEDDFSTDNSSYVLYSGMIGTGKRFHAHKNGCYVNLRSVIRGAVFEDKLGNNTQTADGLYMVELTGLALNVGTGYNGGSNWDKQPGALDNAGGTTGGAGCAIDSLSVSSIPGFDIFQNDDCVVLCVEWEASKFQWMTFGTLNKAGSYVGGYYFAGMCGHFYPHFDWYDGTVNETEDYHAFLSHRTDGNTFKSGIYLTADASAAWRLPNSSGYFDAINICHLGGINPVVGAANLRRMEILRKIIKAQPNSINGLAPFLPLIPVISRADFNYSPVGEISGLRAMNMLNYAAGDTISYGGDTWHIFPLTFHGNGTNLPYLAYAVKE